MPYVGKKATNAVDVAESQSLTVDGDLTVDTSTLKVDSTNNNVGFGTVSPAAPVDSVANTNGVSMRVRARSSDEFGLIEFVENDGSTAHGYIGTPAADTLAFYTNGLNERVRILSGGGLTFNGDTAAANALNDYQEGTWTAGLKATVTNPTVASITNSTGVYTKIGDLVFIQYYSGVINISNGGSGSAYIDGLPFSPSDSPASANQYSVITFTHTNAFTGQIQNGYTARAYAGFFPVLEGTVNQTTWTTGSTLYIMISGVYRTDA